MIDIVGHFGSRLSYATVGAQAARALEQVGLLGRVVNLDDIWLDEHRHLADRNGSHGKAALLIVDPRRYLFDAFAQQYGASRVAVFASPNTTLMDHERAEVCAKAGLVIAPSKWCMDTVWRSWTHHRIEPGTVVVLRLGVSELYAKSRRMRKLHGAGETLRALHFSTDFSWPGRKGTMELLIGWFHVQRDIRQPAVLQVHLPIAIYEDAHQWAAKLGILETVELLLTQDQRGTSDEELVRLYKEADLVVQPSRCEGFGMMMLAALVAGVPLVTTHGTGQEDFLEAMPLGWLGVSTGMRLSEMAGEDGEAPFVEPERVADAVVAACAPSVYERLLRGAEKNREQAELWGWPTVNREWASALGEWMGR